MAKSTHSSFKHLSSKLNLFWLFIVLAVVFNACKPVSTLSTPTSKSHSSTKSVPSVTPKGQETLASSATPKQTNIPNQTKPSSNTETITPTTTKYVFDPSAMLQALDPGADWYILIKDLDSDEVLLNIKANQSFNPASMIKIPLAMAVLNKNKELGRNLDDLEKIGIEGRSFGALLYAMVVKSEERATQILENFAWGDNYLREILDSWGIEETFFDPRRSTCEDLAIALEGLHSQSILDPETSQYLIDLMLVQTENDSKYLGVLEDSLPGSTFANKRGTMTSPTVVADHGLFSYEGKTWMIIIAGIPDESETATFDTIAASIERFAEALATQLQGLASSQP